MAKLVEYKTVSRKTELEKIKITDSKTAADYMREVWDEQLEVLESFYVLYVNRANRTVGYQMHTQGGTAGTIVDVVLMMKGAIDVLAHGILLFHNHPSGNNQPSHLDKVITDKVKQACNLLEIKCLDHIILTEDNHYSFADEGMI